jgi:hypothetical protein
LVTTVEVSFHPLRWLPREALRLLRDVPRQDPMIPFIGS